MDVYTFSNCDQALGMQSGLIPDSALSASSTFDASVVGPANGRLMIENVGGGAWCPSRPIARDSYEWIQIDFDDVMVITKIKTQGRYSQGQGQEFTEMYMLEYRRVTGQNWTRHRDYKRDEILIGNSNTYDVEVRGLEPPIIATSVRVVPYSNHPRTVCMRLELVGCVWKEGLMSYSMPQGETRGVHMALKDYTYDGVQGPDGRLREGLGLLTDGVEGQSSLRSDSDSVRGYHWVGWKDETGIRPPVEILFLFSDLRNFTSVGFHTSNMISREIQVFKKVVLHFSSKSTEFDGPSVIFEQERDPLNEQARTVTVPIPHIIASAIRAELHFSARWIVISEVHFQSSRFVVEERIGSVYMEETDDVSDLHLPQGQHEDSLDEARNPEQRESISADSVKLRLLDRDNLILGAALGTVTLLILLLFVLCVICLVRCGRRSTSRLSAVRDKSDHVTQGLCCWGGVKQTNPVDGSYSCNSEFSRNETNVKSALNGQNTQHDTGEIVEEDAPHGTEENHRDTGPYTRLASREGSRSLRAPQDGGWSQGGESVDSLLQDGLGTLSVETLNESEGIQERNLPELPTHCLCPDYVSDETPQSAYATPYPSAIAGSSHAPYCPLYVCYPRPANQNTRNSPPPLPPPPHPSLVHPNGRSHLQGFSGHSIYEIASRLEEAGSRKGPAGGPVSVGEFVREELNFVQKLGEGPCGEVYLCTVQSPSTGSRSESQCDVTEQESAEQHVIVKVLSNEADSKARSDFYREVAALSSLKDENIVKLIGVCCQREPLCIVTEYLPYGDLKEFLQAHLPAQPSAQSTLSSTSSSNLPTNLSPLSLGCLMYMVTQISSAMRYLEDHNVLHRDLAARNCLVGHLYKVKVTDFGMSRLLNSADYYRIQGRAILPIRWMSWEAVLYGKFSTKSDVWAFGVTVWEVLTLASQQPFQTLTDEQVINNCRVLQQMSEPSSEVAPERHLQLSLPHDTPQEIRDLTLQCWAPEARLRPSFLDINRYLGRMNLTYSPSDIWVTSECYHIRKQCNPGSTPSITQPRLSPHMQPSISDVALYVGGDSVTCVDDIDERVRKLEELRCLQILTSGGEWPHEREGLGEFNLLNDQLLSSQSSPNRAALPTSYHGAQSSRSSNGSGGKGRQEKVGFENIVLVPRTEATYDKQVLVERTNEERSTGVLERELGNEADEECSDIESSNLSIDDHD